MKEGLTITQQAVKAATLAAETATRALELTERADVWLVSITESPLGEPLTKRTRFEISTNLLSA